MDDDRHPGAVKTPDRQCKNEDAANGIRQDALGLVDVIESKKQTVCDPPPPAEDARHFGKRYAPKQQLFSQNGIEDGAHHERAEEPRIDLSRGKSDSLR
jgi:hypothetical protein